MAWGEWDWLGAEAEFCRALELNSNHVEAHQLYGQYLVHNGRIQQGIRELEKAVDLDPFSLETNLFLGWGLYTAREYDASIQQHLKTLEMNPDFAWGHLFLSMSYIEARLQNVP